MSKSPEELERELVELRKEFNHYRLQRQQEEMKRLKTALIAAGAVILALGGFLWTEVLWPLIKSGRH